MWKLVPVSRVGPTDLDDAFLSVPVAFDFSDRATLCAQAGLHLSILLPQPPTYQEYSPALPYCVYNVSFPHKTEWTKLMITLQNLDFMFNLDFYISFKMLIHNIWTHFRLWHSSVSRVDLAYFSQIIFNLIPQTETSYWVSSDRGSVVVCLAYHGNMPENRRSGTLESASSVCRKSEVNAGVAGFWIPLDPTEGTFVVLFYGSLPFPFPFLFRLLFPLLSFSSFSSLPSPLTLYFYL